MTVATTLSQLKGFAGLSNLVGNRIYRVTLPQNPVYPCIQFSVKEKPGTNLDGSKSTPVNYEYVFKVAADSVTTIDGIVKQLELAMAAGAYSAVVKSVEDGFYQDELKKFVNRVVVSIWD